MSLPANFLAKTRKTDCTVWIGAANTLGYGDVYVRANGKSECMECRRIGRRANRRGEPRPTKQRRAERVAADLEQLSGSAS